VFQLLRPKASPQEIRKAPPLTFLARRTINTAWTAFRSAIPTSDGAGYGLARSLKDCGDKSMTGTVVAKLPGTPFARLTPTRIHRLNFALFGADTYLTAPTTTPLARESTNHARTFLKSFSSEKFPARIGRPRAADDL